MSAANIMGCQVGCTRRQSLSKQISTSLFATCLASVVNNRGQFLLWPSFPCLTMLLCPAHTPPHHAAPHLQSHTLLLQLGQQPEIAALASRYLIMCIPCLFLTTTMECIRKYLQSQRAVKPAMAVAAAVLVASPLFFWLLVEQCQLGLDGAALAFIACQVTTLLGLIGYVVYRAWRLKGKREQTWGGWSPEALQGWGEYCSYGLPAAAMIAGEWWAYEVGGCCV